MTRQEANLEIMKILFNYVKEHPDQRWGQILRNTGCVLDHTLLPYSPKQFPQTYWKREMLEEPHVILERMQRELK